MISAKAARSSGGASWFTQPPEKEMTRAGSSPALLKNCGLARSMISRTGDLLHLNVLTFFEIVGFIILGRATLLELRKNESGEGQQGDNRTHPDTAMERRIHAAAGPRD